jgi:hypothetical protein
MGLIIELIIKIFQAIFEEDVGRRPAQTRPPQKQTPAESALAELFAELQNPKQTTPPPVPSHNEAARAREKFRLAELERVRQEKRLVREASEENAIHKGAYEAAAIQVAKELPGDTPLQQMIYAGVILGPCKARAHVHRRL